MQESKALNAASFTSVLLRICFDLYSGPSQPTGTSFPHLVLAPAAVWDNPAKLGHKSVSMVTGSGEKVSISEV